MQDSELSFKKSFRDICNGYCKMKSSLGDFFIKHLNYEDLADLDDLRSDYYQSAKKMGLPTIEESIENLHEEGSWTEKEEKSLTEKETYVLRLQSSKKKLYLKSQIDKRNEEIEKVKAEIYDLKNKRNSLIGANCEDYADQKLTEEFIRKSFYKNEDFKTLAFEEEEFYELDPSDISELVKVYSNSSDSVSDLRIQKLVLCDFFSYYMPFCEDPMQFYGKPIINLTHNQIKLILYARYFQNIFTNSDKIPEEYKKDPEKIMEFVNAKENSKKVIKERDGNSASSIVGAQASDYEYLDLNNNKNTKTVNLSEEAKKKGGALNMQDLMKMMGEE